MTVQLSPDLKRWLVEQAETAAGRAGEGDSSASQLRHLLEVTQTESEVPVLANFIRYQAARSATQKFWRDLHEPVIQDLETIENQKAKDDPALRQVAIQHYFGYLVRQYIYLDKVVRKKKGPPRDSGGAPSGGPKGNKGPQR